MDAKTEVSQCEYCECKTGEIKHGCPMELRVCAYLKDPWSTEEYETLLCDDCEDMARGEEYEHCQVCERDIATTHSNGMRSFFTFLYGDTDESDERKEAYGMHDDGGICTRCLHEHRIKNGLLQCEIAGESAKIPADFYDYDELRKAGYEENETGIFIVSGDDSRGVQKKCRELVASGNSVIIDLERSGMGLEGYVGIWARTIPAAV